MCTTLETMSQLVAQATLDNMRLQVRPLHRNPEDPETRTTVFVLVALGDGDLVIPMGIIYPPHQQKAFLESIRDILPPGVADVPAQDSLASHFPGDPALNGMVALPGVASAATASSPADTNDDMPIELPAWLRQVFEEPSQ